MKEEGRKGEGWSSTFTLFLIKDILITTASPLNTARGGYTTKKEKGGKMELV